MSFKNLLDHLSPKLAQIALKYRSLCPYADQDDLRAEMELFLWEKWRGGELRGATDSYLVQACYFHLRNYLRTAGDRDHALSLDLSPLPGGTSGDEDGGSAALHELIADPAPAVSAELEGRALYETIMNNGLDRRAKEIVRLLLEGYTVREIGIMFGISHAMVVKRKKNIAQAVTRKYRALLV